MGIIEREMHGSLWYHGICEHICDDLENKIFQESLVLPVFMIKMCKNCSNTYKVEELIRLFNNADRELIKYSIKIP